jgi:steroid delta-isomerase-like uncharacterized protein
MAGKHLAYDFAQSLSEHDLDRFARLLHPAYVNHNAFAAPGKAGSVAVFAGFLHAFPDFQVTVEDVFEAGANVIGRFTYRGTFTRPFMGYDPTGAAVEMRSIDIWCVKDGQLAEHWDELNTLDFFMQLGAARMLPPRKPMEMTQ